MDGGRDGAAVLSEVAAVNGVDPMTPGPGTQRSRPDERFLRARAGRRLRLGLRRVVPYFFGAAVAGLIVPAGVVIVTRRHYGGWGNLGSLYLDGVWVGIRHGLVAVALAGHVQVRPPKTGLAVDRDS